MKITNNKLQDFVITFIILMGLTCFFTFLVDPTIFEYTPEDEALFSKQKDFVWVATLINAGFSFLINRK